MKMRLLTGTALAAMLAFGFLLPGAAFAYGNCPGDISVDDLTAAVPTILPLASAGATGLYVGGDTSMLSPYGIVCDLTDDVGYVNGEKGTLLGSFSPIIDTGGAPYFGQAAGDILAVILSTNPFGGQGSNTAALFFMVDGDGNIQPTSVPPNVTGPVSISSGNTASTTLAKPGDVVTLTFSSDSSVRTPTVTIGTHTADVATSTGGGNTFTASATLDSSDAEGAVPFNIQLTNYFGNPGPAVSATTDGTSVTFDKTAPVITVTSGPSDGGYATSSPVAFSISTDDASAPVLYSFDADATSTYSGGISQALADGAHALYLSSTDEAGNATSSMLSFTVETAAPVIAITSGPADGAFASSSDAAFEFTVDASSTPTATCSLDGAGTTSPCASPQAFSGLGEGSHAFAISVIDAAGNTASTTTSFTVDTTAPVLSETAAIGTTTDATPGYGFTSSEAGTLSVGGSCSSASTAAVAGSNTVTFTTLSTGVYSDCTVSVTDAAGNVSAPLAVSTFEIDAPAPTPAPVVASGGGGSNGPPVAQSAAAVSPAQTSGQNSDFLSDTQGAPAGQTVAPASAPSTGSSVSAGQTFAPPAEPAPASQASVETSQTPAPVSDGDLPAAVESTHLSISPWYLLILPLGAALWWTWRKFSGVQ